MALEVIQAIKEAEAKAEELKKQAAADGKELIKKAERQNEEFFEKKSSEARDKASNIAADYEAQVQKEQQGMKAEALAKTEELKERAALKMAEAVNFILGRLE